jgi:signal transduction histidine kinase
MPPRRASPRVVDVTRQGDVARGRAAVARVARAVSRALPWLAGAWYGLVTLDYADSPAAAWGGVALAGVLGAALVWRRDHPELVAAVVLGASLAAHLLVPEIVVPFAGMVAVGSLALTRPPRVSLVGLAGLLAVSATNLLTTTLDDTVFTMVLAVSVWALAEAARNRRTAISEAARRAVSEEQARIARELHDVLAHSVSVIVVQAGAAGDVFDARPDQARAALRSIEGAGREALRELRRLLTGVRIDDGGAARPAGTDAPMPPQPGVDRVDELAEPLRAAGLRVVVTREGPASPLPPGVDISAYRIVQEALTNTLRHAQATAANVTLRYCPDAVEIDVVDDGRGPTGRTGDGPGFGLIGMNERAASLGGTLEAGPTAHGGYRIHARLPLDATR